MAVEDFKWLWTDAVFSRPLTLAKFRRGLALFMIELYGTAIFFGLSCSSLVNTGIITGNTDHTDVTFAVVLAVGTAVWTCSHISVLLNPGLTVAGMILGHFSIYRVIILILGQLIGAVVGIIPHYLLLPDLDKSYCKVKIHPEVALWQAFLYEVLISAYLCWALCGLIDKRRHPVFRNLTIKFIIVLVPLFLHTTRLFGSTVNPAFTFGTSMVALDFTNSWIGIVGPLVGCIIWSLLYRFMFDSYVEEKSEAKTLYNVVE